MKKPKPEPTYTIALSPFQRLQIAPAFREFKGPFENPEQGRLFRRVHERLGLPVIMRTADLNGGKLSAAQAASQAPALFAIDFYEAQMLKKVLDGMPRSGHLELTIGDLADRVDVLASGHIPDPIEGKYFDATAESWDPPREPAEGTA